ncbi:protein-methionine-sulfoxide reductase catalytic subunit MsrP [Methylophaga sp. OBS4]|uniref:protein-methionine-sulfoxide reductase catalytic subunit MsrP n=1 Tax=Methylophaga sp. OBS4 TaxID=2991935 RepID=UPI002256F0FB|nr:protein-methionine-sulfoxide reductase catalytic subunit MsrP [Methylophaga sp. OBS4]MCX4188081.1 protein-methionine-sulfoxide reductase catalytic subunit MsrP [Methylophaga sp. OBS4]
MFIHNKKPWDLPESEVTDYQVYKNRRQFLNVAITVGIASALPSIGQAKPVEDLAVYPDLISSPFSTKEEKTTFEAITTYNNFYEFGTAKSEPSLYATEFPDESKPWRVVIDGECDNPGEFEYDALVKPFTLEERIYRMRCVEGWSMVIPWIGFPLGDLLKKAQPNSRAKYVEFTTLYDPEQMPGQQREVLDWPYVEGLRIDEAMHPLTILSVGLYGKELLGQNGAPLRLVVPWKYGFKSIKSIVRIRFVENMPLTAWVKANASEYGFYSNVNPNVDHPRWSQRRERRIGEFLKRKTEMFNGYGDYVADLYSGMDLKRYF